MGAKHFVPFFNILVCALLVMLCRELTGKVVLLKEFFGYAEDVVILLRNERPVFCATY